MSDWDKLCATVELKSFFPNYFHRVEKAKADEANSMIGRLTNWTRRNVNLSELRDQIVLEAGFFVSVSGGILPRVMDRQKEIWQAYEQLAKAVARYNEEVKRRFPNVPR